MDKPVVTFAMAATVVGVVALGLFERIVPCHSAVVRAEEKKEEEKKKKEEGKKEKVGLGFTYRQRQIQTQPGISKPIEMTSTVRVSPEHGYRVDRHALGKLTGSTYVNYAEGTTISLFHTRKMYTRREGAKGSPPAEQTPDPRVKLKKALAGEHKKLGRRTIDGVEAEGIEVQNPEGFGSNFKIDSVVSQFWSSVETGYPILVEQNVVGGGGAIRIKTIDDQFRWNLRFDPNEFKAKIPPGYQLDTRPPGQEGVGRGSMSGSAGTFKSGQKARRGPR